jgi:hypothetical protein
MRAVTAELSDEVLRLAHGYDAVGIDQVQFFDEGIVDAIDGLVCRGDARRRGRARAGLPRPAVRRDADPAASRSSWPVAARATSPATTPPRPPPSRCTPSASRSP